MRTLLRTTLVTMLVVFSVLIAWSFIYSPNSAQSGQAASGVPTGVSIPSYCVSEVLAGLQGLEAQTTSSEGRKLLMGKEQAARQAELECVANATAHPPAKKPAELVGVLLPTETPGTPVPTATLQIGIQNGNYVSYSADIFIPTENSNNLWADFVNGNVVQVFAGSRAERDENWRQDHPEWVTQGAQGVLYVVVNYDVLKGKLLFPTPSRHGAVHFVAACGSTLVLQATDGTTFVFDASTLTYVSNSDSCPILTP